MNDFEEEGYRDVAAGGHAGSPACVGLTVARRSSVP